MIRKIVMGIIGNKQGESATYNPAKKNNGRPRESGISFPKIYTR
jgi:hypothetical protein